MIRTLSFAASMAILALPSIADDAPDRRGPIIDPIAFGAVCDGATDDATALQDAIDQASEINAGVVFIRGLCATSREIRLGSNVELQGLSGGSGLRAVGTWSKGEALIDVTGTDVSIRGLSLDANDLAGNCIKADESGTDPFGLRIERVRCGGARLDGVFLGGKIAPRSNRKTATIVDLVVRSAATAESLDGDHAALAVEWDGIKAGSLQLSTGSRGRAADGRRVGLLIKGDRNLFSDISITATETAIKYSGNENTITAGTIDSTYGHDVVETRSATFNRIAFMVHRDGSKGADGKFDGYHLAGSKNLIHEPEFVDTGKQDYRCIFSHSGTGGARNDQIVAFSKPAGAALYSNPANELICDAKRRGDIDFLGTNEDGAIQNTNHFGWVLGRGVGERVTFVRIDRKDDGGGHSDTDATIQWVESGPAWQLGFGDSGGEELRVGDKVAVLMSSGRRLPDACDGLELFYEQPRKKRGGTMWVCIEDDDGDWGWAPLIQADAD